MPSTYNGNDHGAHTPWVSCHCVFSYCLLTHILWDSHQQISIAISAVATHHSFAANEWICMGKYHKRIYSDCIVRFSLGSHTYYIWTWPYYNKILCVCVCAASVARGGTHISVYGQWHRINRRARIVYDFVVRHFFLSGTTFIVGRLINQHQWIWSERIRGPHSRRQRPPPLAPKSTKSAVWLSIEMAENFFPYSNSCDSILYWCRAHWANVHHGTF